MQDTLSNEGDRINRDKVLQEGTYVGELTKETLERVL